MRLPTSLGALHGAGRAHSGCWGSTSSGNCALLATSEPAQPPGLTARGAGDRQVVGRGAQTKYRDTRV